LCFVSNSKEIILFQINPIHTIDLVIVFASNNDLKIHLESFFFLSKAASALLTVTGIGLSEKRL
jgi:hypothetical protein